MDENINENMEIVLRVLRKLRIKGIYEEYEIQESIAKLLKESGIEFHKEFKLGPRNRIDFLLETGIGIEVKKGKPYSMAVIKQLERYTGFKVVKGIILVIERNLDIPNEINAKPCLSLGLNKLWGIAL